jgi:methylenetetrahydrofolate--tRNA-(uracil-5-)-methyltransferase
MATAAVIGAGLAGSEAALVLARNGITVDLFEMRPGTMTPAHKTDLPAELICSNSFKAYGTTSAHGLLKTELEMLHSPLLGLAKASAIPAGCALAVDRHQFAQSVLDALQHEPNIILKRQECLSPSENHQYTLIAAGPLASSSLTDWIQKSFNREFLNFYDAIAPIISGDSINMSTAFFGERRDPASSDYINCPFTEEEYRNFWTALCEADKAVAREFEEARFFEACLPVEVIANREFSALAYGVLKPIGFIDPRTGRRPFALCQLRKENKAGDSYNMVGFQTRLIIPSQQKVFRMIPSLEQAEFLRYGSIHRNTYLDSPKLLNDDLSFKTMDNVFCAGQICGSEGYTESISTGHLAAMAIIKRIQGSRLIALPTTTALGALVNHVVHSETMPFTPSNINYGLFPALAETPNKRKIGKAGKWVQLCDRAKAGLNEWILNNI